MYRKVWVSIIMQENFVLSEVITGVFFFERLAHYHLFFLIESSRSDIVWYEQRIIYDTELTLLNTQHNEFLSINIRFGFDIKEWPRSLHDSFFFR